MPVGNVGRTLHLLTDGTSLERIGDESLTQPCSRFDHHQMLIDGHHDSPHAESPFRRRASAAPAALTFASRRRNMLPAADARASQESDFIGDFFTPDLPLSSPCACGVNVPPKAGTNRRRITDRDGFPFRSLLDVVAGSTCPQQVHSLSTLIRTSPGRPR